MVRTEKMVHEKIYSDLKKREIYANLKEMGLARETAFSDGTFGPVELRNPKMIRLDESEMESQVYGWFCPRYGINKRCWNGGTEQFAGKVAKSRGHNHADRMYTPFITYDSLRNKPAPRL